VVRTVLESFMNLTPTSGPVPSQDTKTKKTEECCDIYNASCDKSLLSMSLTHCRQERGEIFRQLYGELEPLSRARMIQGKFCRVKEVTFK
jgi:hypothetical protein